MKGVINMRIFIDKGHTVGFDPGAVSKTGQTEAKTNQNTAEFLRDMLVKDGHDVLLGEVKGKKFELNDRVKMAQMFSAEISISIHHNAGGGKGSEVFCEINDSKSKKLADCIMAEFSKINESRGVKTRVSTKDATKNGLAMLNIKNCVCVLTEFCFMDSEIKEIDTHEEQKIEAQAIYNGLKAYFKVVK
jgi:N-acetylmuramoyl-L-alanine amidase